MEYTLNVGGMHCHNCETRLETVLRATEGVTNAKANHEEGLVTVGYDPSRIDLAEIKEVIEDCGFEPLS